VPTAPSNSAAQTFLNLPIDLCDQFTSTFSEQTPLTSNNNSSSEKFLFVNEFDETNFDLELRSNDIRSPLSIDVDNDSTGSTNNDLDQIS
jgi:hypothetical protein